MKSIYNQDLSIHCTLWDWIVRAVFPMGCHGVFVLCCKYKETLSIQGSAHSSCLLFTNLPWMPDPQISEDMFVYFAIFLMGGKMLSLHLFLSIERLQSATKYLPCPIFLLWNLQLSLAFSTKQTLKMTLTHAWGNFTSQIYLSKLSSQEFSGGRLQTHIATSSALWLDEGFLPSR